MLTEANFSTRDSRTLRLDGTQSEAGTQNKIDLAHIADDYTQTQTHTKREHVDLFLLLAYIHVIALTTNCT